MSNCQVNMTNAHLPVQQLGHDLPEAFFGIFLDGLDDVRKESLSKLRDGLRPLGLLVPVD
jgi:hypothetical protein